MRFTPAIVLITLTTMSLFPIIASAQEDNRSRMATTMGGARRAFMALEKLITSEDKPLESALELLNTLQAALLKAKTMTPPDLAELEQSVKESIDTIRRGLANAMRATIDLEIAIYDDDRSAAQLALENIDSIRRKGHDAVRIPLRTMRNEKLLASLENLTVSDEFADAVIGHYMIPGMEAIAEVIHNDNNRLSIVMGGQPPFELRRQSDNTFRLKPAPQTILSFDVQDGRAIALIMKQGEMTQRAERVEE